MAGVGAQPCTRSVAADWEESHFQWSGDEGWEPLATFILGFPPVWQDARSRSGPSP